MHGPGKLLGQGLVDEPLAGKAGKALERFGNDLHVKMALAACPRPRMAAMETGIVADGQRRGRKARGELLADAIGDRCGCHFARESRRENGFVKNELSLSATTPIPII